MMEISKRDWKLFCDKIPEWQERHMDALLREYVALINSPGDASVHFWELEERIKKDKKNPGVQLELRKSEAVYDIAAFVSQKIISFDDLNEFSEELRATVESICNAGMSY